MDIKNTLQEQTLIAKKLGISNTVMRRIARNANLKFELINNKRHYYIEDFLDAIKMGMTT